MIKIDTQLLDKTSEEAKAAPRRRMNFNFHKNSADTLQRMLNAIEPASYVQPHKHENPDKREVFFVLRGRMAVLEFDELGNITDLIILNPLKGNFGVEIPAKTYHTIISLEQDTVAYEVKDGPYNPLADKNFAPWAPEEGSAEAEQYLKAVLDRTGIRANI